MRILLVEDSERLQLAVSTGLRREGHGVDVASDGEEGLRYARNNPYDVIVLDLMLPKLDGLGVLRELRSKASEVEGVHVLILTAKDTVEERVEGLRAGADDYLVKPFSFDELLARIEAALDRGEADIRPESQKHPQPQLNFNLTREQAELALPANTSTPNNPPDTLPFSS